MFLLHYFTVNYFLITCASQAANYDYTIQVPKFPCTPVNNEDVSIIRISGKDADKLQLEWDVRFKTNHTCQQQQRCTLLIWRSVRSVGKLLNNKTKEIKINNTLLMPIVQYTLNVTVKVDGVVVDFKYYVLECTNSTSIEGTKAPPEKLNNDPRVDLFGANVTYRDLTYILNAEAVNIVENSTIYYKWEILDQDQKLIKFESAKGSVLELKPNVLAAKNSYLIKCCVINSGNNSVIAMATQNLIVLSREMVLLFTVRTLSVGVKKRFKLFAYFQDDDNQNEKLELVWTCVTEKSRPCINFKSINSTIMEDITLTNAGLYNFSITVTKNNKKLTDTCKVLVVADAYAEIDVDEVDVPVNPSKDIVIRAYISTLRSGCSLKWISVKSSQYDYINFDEVPGNIGVTTNITVMEDKFLNEIDEYSNRTTEKQYNLIIPKANGKWLGVKGNASYLFRLNVLCPDLKKIEDSRESIEQVTNRRMISLNADVTIFTDIPPALNSLKVNPLNGTALKTQFSFNAVSSDHSSYVLYKFGYFMNNDRVFVKKLLGTESCQNVLPYVAAGVKTVLEACNSRDLCTEKLGPIILTYKPNFTKDDYAYFEAELRELMKREEYYKTYVEAISILHTYKNMKEVKIANDFEKFIIDLVNTEIKRLLKLDKNDGNWQTLATNLLKDIGILLNAISPTDELLNNIVLLRNKVAHKNNISELVEYVEPRFTSRRLLSFQRSKRETNKISLEEVKSYLVISELIITTSTDYKRVQQEKQHLLNQVDKFMVPLCSTLHEKSQTMNLDLKTMSLSLEKLNKNNINRYFNILHETNVWNVSGKIKLGKCFIENLTFTNQLCLGKALFKNYLNMDGFVYMIKVYGSRSSDQLKFQDMLCLAVLVLPTDHEKLVQKEPKCTLWRGTWEESQCNTLQVVSRTIQCQCQYLGYYGVKYDDVTTTLGTTILTSTTTSTSSLLPATVTSLGTSTTWPTSTIISTSERTTPKYITTTESYTNGNTTTYNEINKEESQVLYYCITGISISGTVILCYCIKRLLSKTTPKQDDEYPKYENIHDEDLLDDFPESNASSIELD